MIDHYKLVTSAENIARLDEAEAEIKRTKRAYHDAIAAKKKLQRDLADSGELRMVAVQRKAVEV